MRTRVCVCGPISLGDLGANIAQARAAGLALLKAGYSPLVFALSCFAASDIPEVLPGGTTWEEWLGGSLAWVAAADAVLRLPGESRGADQETALARQLGIPVYDNLRTLLREVPAERPGNEHLHALLGAIGRLPSAHVLYEEAAALVSEGMVMEDGCGA